MLSRLPFLKHTSAPKDATGPLDQYVYTFPAAQNAVDMVPGWNHAFPPELGLAAGHAALYNDDRINWCLEQAGSVSGQIILELGPLEAMHTYMFAKAGAAHIDAIEANRLAYMRCLITREILKFHNASFHLGDFNLWMEQSDQIYDLVVASGVLYHSADPIRLLELISQSARRFFIWTHYFNDALGSAKDPRGFALSGRVKEVEFKGVKIRLHERYYYQAWQNPQFCGGPKDLHYWLSREDILAIIDALGFDSVTAHDEPDHVNGPAISIFAKRKSGNT